METLHSELFTGYNKKLFPVLDNSEQVNIAVTVGLVSINTFDEISGEIVLTMIFYMQWVDERLKWTPAEYGNKTSLLIPLDDIWHPQLYLLQSSDNIQELGINSQWARLNYSGVASWYAGDVLKVVCSVDVTYFPFDSQTCSVTISGWMYTNEEILLYTTSGSLDNKFLSTNSQWKYVSGDVSNFSLSATFPPSINVNLTLKRRSEFFTVYIIIPIIFLGIINNLVFAMPANSGERTSVAITAFLSFIVYMQIINNNVPESSSPIAYIYYYLLFLMVYSSMIIVLCIVSLRIHDRDGEVSDKIKALTRYLRFWCIIYRRSHKTGPSLSRSSSVTDPTYVQSLKNYETEEVDQTSDEPGITWKIVGKTFDRYCCACLSLTFWSLTIATFSNLYYNRGL
jgi:hypothetical protein